MGWLTYKFKLFVKELQSKKDLKQYVKKLIATTSFKYFCAFLQMFVGSGIAANLSSMDFCSSI